MTVLSYPPEHINLLSGENLAFLIQFICPDNVKIGFFVYILKTLHVLSSEEVSNS
jgi:hypothetical protein